MPARARANVKNMNSANLQMNLSALLYNDKKKLMPSFNGWFRFRTDMADLPQFRLYRGDVVMVLKHKYGLLP